MKFILGRKLGMSQIFNEKGEIIPLTWVEAGPCFVTQIKTKEKDNYQSLQVGFIKKKSKTLKKTEKGKNFKYIREVRGSKIGNQELKVGDKIDVSLFLEGDSVNIVGTSKGKGFQGVVKRWGFAGAPKTHGTKHMLRMPGAIGDGGVERVFKGKKMGGRMGGTRTTVKNLKIVKIIKEQNLIAVKGAIPGPKGVLLEVKGD